MLLAEIATWLGGKEAGMYIGFSRDYVEARAAPWQDDYLPFRVRYKHAIGEQGGQPTRRYYRPDLDALLVDPTTPSRGLYFPRFHKGPGKGNVARGEA
jgi:hypothetical protein